MDGFADVYLNGVRLKRVENAFRRYALPVSNLLARGEQNEIKIVFTPVDEVLGSRVDELAGWKEKRVFMRKPQYNFGWDWALPMPGVGVFGYVKIEYDYEYEIIDYSVKTTLNGRLDFDFEVNPDSYERGYEIKVKVYGHGEDHSFSINRKQHRTYGHVLLKNPKLWWPNGYGEQPLYDYQIELFVAGEKVQEIAGKVGIKQVELLEEPFTKEAGDGYSFWLIVNGERVFIKGGNWIPMELWPGKIDERNYEFQIKMSQFANFNMLRVWGGGIYEKERFYDLCENTDYLYLDIVANGEQKSAQVYFPFGWKDLNLPQPSCEASVTKIEEIDGVYRAQISVKANDFVRLYHAFNKDNLNPVFSDNYFDMEKGDEKFLYAYFTQKPQISYISFGDFTTEWE